MSCRLKSGGSPIPLSLTVVSIPADEVLSRISMEGSARVSTGKACLNALETSSLENQAKLNGVAHRYRDFFQIISESTCSCFRAPQRTQRPVG